MMKPELLMLAQYHCWSFDVLYGALSPVTDAQYRADCGLFFGSIHRTLNHLLLADRVWFGRICAPPYPVSRLDEELESDRDNLERAIDAHTGVWQNWIEAQTDSVLASVHTYANMSGTSFSNSMATTLLHVFNHGTHHRGQISAAISGFGHPAPEMDLIFYLRSASLVEGRY